MKRWWGALLCGAVALLALPASPVSAHASFEGSDPADGSVFATAPQTASLRFSEEVLLEASHVTLLRLGSGESDELELSAADGGSTLEVQLPTLPKGAYILRFVAVDPADLHKTVGSISFGVGVAPPPSQSGSQIEGSWWTTAIRAITDAALLVGAGAVVVVWLAVRRKVAAIDAATRLATVCLVASAIGWGLLFLADVTAVGWQYARWGSVLTGSDPGRRALVGVELALAAWWVGRTLRKAGVAHRPLFATILALVGAGFVVAAAYGGHAGIGGNFAAGVVLRGLHYGSLCVWIGAVAATWLLARRSDDMRTLWPEVSRLAAIGLAVTGATGLLLSGRMVLTVTALLSTTYGKVVIGKVVALVMLAALGGFAARRVVRGAAPAVSLELAVGAIAVVLASLLASSVPARGERFTPLPVAAPQVVTGDVLDLTVSASIQPARPGANLVQLRVLDTRRPAPGQIDGIELRLTRSDGTVVAQRAGALQGGVVEWADVSIAGPGTYTVDVAVTRPAVPVPVFTSKLVVEAAPVTRADTVLSDRSWAPLALVGAGLWLAVVVAGRVLVRGRRQASNR